MKKYVHAIKPKEEFIDITKQVQKDILKAGYKDGIAIIYTPHTTLCVRILENETLLKLDMRDFMQRIASTEGYYRHDDIEHRDVPPDERRNGYSHIRAMMLNNQEIVPFFKGALDLGKWQSIFLMETDLGKENRQYYILVINGEKL